MTENCIFKTAAGFSDPAALPFSIENISDSQLDWSDYGKNGESAVAVIFIPPTNSKSNTANIILTRRTTTVGTHKGQIGFAGGRADPSDKSPIETALRETTEELGIPQDRMTVHGILPTATSVYSAKIYPIVVTSDIKPNEISISKQEVEEVIVEPWTSFTQKHNKPFSFKIFGITRQSNLYSLPNNPVWGITAKILTTANLK